MILIRAKSFRSHPIFYKLKEDGHIIKFVLIRFLLNIVNSSFKRYFKTRLPEGSYKKAKDLVLLKEDGH